MSYDNSLVGTSSEEVVSPGETNNFANSTNQRTTSLPVEVKKKENYVENILQLQENNKSDNIKNLYENIGTRVSKLREVNENYQTKIKSQDEELKMLDQKIKERQYVLETEMRDQKKLQDPEWVHNKYEEMLRTGSCNLKINHNHIQNDPELMKIYNIKQAEVSFLQNKLNNLIKKTEHVKSEINTLRIENYKHQTSLDLIIQKKEVQSKEMDRISEEANKYLKEKGTINQELLKLNEHIDNQKSAYESKVLELNKMIDNIKKIKEFHETLALDKFSKHKFRKPGHDESNLSGTDENNNNNNNSAPRNKISEEQHKLLELNKELKRKKQQTVYLNFCKFILFKKQQSLNKMIEKIKNETGVENLENLSKYLELSTKTNKLFQTDLKSLNEQKFSLEKQIENIKVDIQKAMSVLNDTSTKKFQYLDKIKVDLKKEEDVKENLNRKLYMLNRIIDLLSHGFKDVCLKLNFFDNDLNFPSDNSEDTLTRCMDFLEKKMIEMIQYNTDPLKPDDTSAEHEQIKSIAVLEKVADNICSEDYVKNLEAKRMNNTMGYISIKDIRDNANDLVNNYIRKFEKSNI